MEDSTVISCPTCGKKFEISPEQLGRTFKCAGCQTQFQAGSPQQTGTGDLQFASSAAPPAFNPASMPPQTMNYNSGAMGGPGGAGTSGMAIASLVCGILICVPFCSLLALIFGIIGITQTKPGQAKGRGMAIAGTVLGGLGLLLVGPALLISILLPSLNKARETANRAKCASNMHQIGLAILLYQNENQQEYPPDLTTLLNTEQLTPAVFVCPASNDTPAATPAQLESGGHCSYKYIRPGAKVLNPGVTPVLYEASTDHAGDGTNILFADGHAQWFSRAAARQYIPNP